MWRYRVNTFIAWGATICFLIALVSGVILAYPFSEARPLVSTVGIENVVPFGWFLRRLHYFSALLSVIGLLIHAGEALLARAYQKRTAFYWMMLTLSVLVILGIAFTGYVLRGDETGRLAGYIAESLALTLPYGGKFLNALLFMVREDGVHRVYLFHFWASFLVFGLAGIWHFRLRALPPENLGLWLLVCGGLALWVPVGLEAEGMSLTVRGPWFFVGVQEALRHVPPAVGGLLLPALGPFLYALLVWGRAERLLRVFLVIWLIFYLGLSLYGFWR